MDGEAATSSKPSSPMADGANWWRRKRKDAAFSALRRRPGRARSRAAARRGGERAERGADRGRGAAPRGHVVARSSNSGRASERGMEEVGAVHLAQERAAGGGVEAAGSGAVRRAQERLDRRPLGHPRTPVFRARRQLMIEGDGETDSADPRVSG